ncbi:MAG: response regulator [Acidobacteria bacterium]|nr:response regulator [Acidobacteriota bacterium]
MPRLVLIADDSDQLAATIEIALSGFPELEVVSVSDGARAYQCLSRDTSVCALVTDLNMPRMDGFELIERLRSNDRLSRLPVIAVSGDTDPRTPSRVLALGADAYFAKPFSPAELRDTLARLIGRGARE